MLVKSHCRKGFSVVKFEKRALVINLLYYRGSFGTSPVVSNMKKQSQAHVVAMETQ